MHVVRVGNDKGLTPARLSRVFARGLSPPASSGPVFSGTKVLEDFDGERNSGPEAGFDQVKEPNRGAGEQ